MRDYQPNKKNNPYWMEKSVYRRVLAFVRDYDRMVRDYHEILHETAASDGQPKTHAPGDPVERKIERMDAIWGDIRAIEIALMEVPPEYRSPVMRKVITDKWPVNVPAGKNLPGYWKKRFLYRVAKKQAIHRIIGTRGKKSSGIIKTLKERPGNWSLYFLHGQVQVPGKTAHRGGKEAGK